MSNPLKKPMQFGLRLMLAILTIGALSQATWAQIVEEEEQFKEVEIEPGPRAERAPREVMRPRGLPGKPHVILGGDNSRFIGIAGISADPVLKSHLKLDKEVGIVVVNVVKDSPADKAGIEKEDIIVTANGEGVGSLEDLAKVVRDAKEGATIELDIIHQGERKTVSVSPDKRKPEAHVKFRFAPGADEGAGHLGTFAIPLPGGSGFDASKMPGGLSISIAKENDQPAKVTVQRGEDKWEFNADDQKAIDELPDDVRKSVEPMLKGGNMTWRGAGQKMFLRPFDLNGLPEAKGPHGDFTLPIPDGVPAEFHEQLKEMQQQMEKMREEMQDFRKEMKDRD